MRLLNVHTNELEEFFDSSIPEYAILSHTWGEGEILFTDLVSRDGRLYADATYEAAADKHGWTKVGFTCNQASFDKIDYVWIDTLSIDKRSSSELSEAINSMFQWYSQAVKCYVYLADIDSKSLEERPVSSSRWFTRGWTLQELLAPQHVMFFDVHGIYLGAKWYEETDEGFIHMLSRVTTIPTNVLRFAEDLHSVSIARRMSWASSRETSRIEDTAYCLLGIFGINLSLIYGEGHNAFYRLQLEIMRLYDDHSIFAWGFANHRNLDTMEFSGRYGTLGHLATSPFEFRRSGSIVSAPVRPDDVFGGLDENHPIMMPNGIRIELPVLRIVQSDATTKKEIQAYVALIGCASTACPSAIIGILLFLEPSKTGAQTSAGKHHLRMLRRSVNEFEGPSCLLVPIERALDAKKMTLILAQRFTHAWAPEPDPSTFEQPVVLLRVSGGARSCGLRGPLKILPVPQTVQLTQESKTLDTTSEEVRIFWSEHTSDCYRMCFTFDDRFETPNVIWMMVVDKVISVFMADPSDTSQLDYCLAQTKPLIRHLDAVLTFVIEDILFSVTSSTVAIYHQTFTKITIHVIRRSVKSRIVNGLSGTEEP